MLRLDRSSTSDSLPVAHLHPIHTTRVILSIYDDANTQSSFG